MKWMPKLKEREKRNSISTKLPIQTGFRNLKSDKTNPKATCSTNVLGTTTNVASSMISKCK